MHETQAELEKTKDEMREIQKQNSQLKNEIAFKFLLETGEKIIDINQF